MNPTQIEMLKQASIFILGALVGGIGVYSVTHKRMESEINETLDELSEYRNKLDEKSDLLDEKVELLEKLMNSKENTESFKVIKDNEDDPDVILEYEEVLKPYRGGSFFRNDISEEKYEEAEKIISQYVSDRPKEVERVVRDPYLIHEDDYGEIGYDVLSYDYYIKDEVVVDGDEALLFKDDFDTEGENLLGNPDMWYPRLVAGDTVYIRDERLERDIQIVPNDDAFDLDS